MDDGRPTNTPWKQIQTPLIRTGHCASSRIFRMIIGTLTAETTLFVNMFLGSCTYTNDEITFLNVSSLVASYNVVLAVLKRSDESTIFFFQSGSKSSRVLEKKSQ